MKLQFRLRTLMIVVTLLAVPLGYVGWQAKIVREREAMRERITKLDKGYFWGWSKIESPTVPWIRRLLGDEGVQQIILRFETDHEERRRIKQVFPEAVISWSIEPARYR